MRSTLPSEPAFPTPTKDGKFDGMTMREWFAGQALAGLLGATASNDTEDAAPMLFFENAKIMLNVQGGETELARLAFNLADAMLAQAKRH